MSAFVGGDEGGSKLAPGRDEVGFLLADALAGLEETTEERVVVHGGGFSAMANALLTESARNRLPRASVIVRPVAPNPHG